MTNYLGVDIGYKRIGLSVGSDDLKLALPIPALIVNSQVDVFQKLAEIVQDMRIDVVVFGYPLNMDGSSSKMTQYVQSFIEDFRQYVPENVKFEQSDERLTSNQAETDKRAYLGTKMESAKRKKSARKKGIIDSNAAAIILQDYLNELSLKTDKMNTETLIEGNL